MLPFLVTPDLREEEGLDVSAFGPWARFFCGDIREEVNVATLNLTQTPGGGREWVVQNCLFREEAAGPIWYYLPYAASRAIRLMCERPRPRSAKSRLLSELSSLTVVL